MASKTQYTLAQTIDMARDGKTQTSIIKKMVEKGCVISDVQFSRKKMGVGSFTEDELKVLSEILDIDLTNVYD